MSGIEAGLYEAAGTPMAGEVRLRVERSSAGSLAGISGDLIDGGGVVSFVSQGDLVESSSGIAFDATLYANSAGSTGSARVQLATARSGVVTLTGDFGRGPGIAELVRIGSALRRLILAVDALDIANVAVPNEALLGGGDGNLVACFGKASIEVAPTPRMTVRPDPYNRSIHTPAELHDLMTTWGTPPRRAVDPWWLHVLLGGRFDGRGSGDVTGIMYDVSTEKDRFPRQGVAVFLASNSIAGLTPHGEEWKREILFTLVHEIGHGLNLPHPFDEGRNDALTWMNYPSRVGANFWEGFKDSFDDRELRFLCHAPHIDIAPGACAYAKRRSDLLTGGRSDETAFRHVPKAEEGDEGALPGLQIAPLKGNYSFGEPVFLKLTLANAGGKSMRYAKAFDPSDGLVTITIVKPHGDARVIRSPLALCQNHRLRRLAPGKEASFDGIFAAFDADGAIFDEPGRYTISASFAGVPGQVLTSPEARFRVLHPRGDEERVAILLWDQPKLMRAIQLRQPLLARAEWEGYREAATRLLPPDPDNTTRAFLTYTAAMGWMKPHKPACSAHVYDADLEKAKMHLRDVRAAHLPSGVGHKMRQVAKELPQR